MAYAPGGSGRSRTVTRGTTTPASGGSASGRPGPKTAPAPPGRRSTTFLAGLGIGLAIGAAAALLLTPRTGAETREALRSRGKRVRSKAGDAWDELRVELARTTRALRRKRREAREEIEKVSPGS